MASSAALTTTHLPQLRGLLNDWERKQPPSKGFVNPVRAERSTDHDDNTSTASKDVVVAFRTRPPLENEAAQKFEESQGRESESSAPQEGAPIEFCNGISIPSAEPGVFVAHVPGMKWNGPTLAHKPYEADLAFAPDVSNEEVYQRTVVANDLLPLVLSGGVGCILAYGQTGSGKTFTMEGLEHRIARDLFEAAHTAGQRLLSSVEGARGVKPKPNDGTGVFELSVSFLELLGKSATDLVAENTGTDVHGNPVRREIAIREDKVGDVRPELISTSVKTSAELEALITSSLAHRRTSATLRNATSSRSHALLNIRVKNTLLPFADEGQLILVDLAGSERYEDSKAHNKARMDESRENNKSLMNLKECVRAKAKMAQEDGFVHIPWRSNKLTILLKPIFDMESRRQTKTMIIAHVSPHIQDTVHSTNTLSYAAPFKTAPPKLRGPAPYDPKDPRTWDHDQTVAWMKEEFSERAPDGIPFDMNVLCPAGFTARHFGKMYTTQFIELCLDSMPAPAYNSHVDETSKGELTKMAAEVIGQLFYLIMSAKTRTRNEVMKSRKKLNENEIYGTQTVKTEQGTEKAYEHMVVDPDDMIGLREDIPDEEFHKTTKAYTEKARAEGTSYAIAYDNAIRHMLEKWRAEKVEKAKKEPGA